MFQLLTSLYSTIPCREREERGVKGWVSLLWVQFPLIGCVPYAVEFQLGVNMCALMGKFIVLNQSPIFYYWKAEKSFMEGARVCEWGQRRRVGSQWVCSTGSTETGKQSLTPSPPSLFLLYGWLPDVRSACQVDWTGAEQALFLSADVTVVRV